MFDLIVFVLFYYNAKILSVLKNVKIMKCFPTKLDCTIRHFLILLDLNARRFQVSIFLYIEKERSTSTDVIGTYLKHTKSINLKSSGKSSKFSCSPDNTHTTFWKFQPSIYISSFFSNTVSIFFTVFPCSYLFGLIFFFAFSTIEIAQAIPCFSRYVIAFGKNEKSDSRKQVEFEYIVVQCIAAQFRQILHRLY